MAGYGGVKVPEHVWKLIARESGDPVSTLTKGKGSEGSISEGENPTD